MAISRGLDCVLYENTHASAPTSETWAARQSVTSVNVGGNKARADVTTRGGNGWRQQIGTLKDGEVTFDVIYDDADALMLTLFDMDQNGTIVDFCFARGNAKPASTVIEGIEGFRAQFSLVDFSESQELEDVVRFSVTLAVSYSAGGLLVPGWYESDDAGSGALEFIPISYS